MQFIDFKDQTTERSNFMYDSIYFQSPGEYERSADDDLDDEEDEDFDDRGNDIDDLHEIQVDDDLNEPDADSGYDITNPDPDDDHFPDDDLQ